MPETANLSNQEARESQTETVTTDSLKQQIAELAQRLKLNLKYETLPKALTIGAPKEIAGARIPELLKLLTDSKKEFDENAEALKRAADAIRTSVEGLLTDPSFPNAWKMRAWQRQRLDLIDELKSILNLYREHLARLAEKKAKEDEETREVAEISEIPKTYDALVSVIKTEFLEQVTAEAKNPAQKAVSYAVWEDFFNSARKIIERDFRGKKNEETRLQVMQNLASLDTEHQTFSIQRDSNGNLTDITINNPTLRTFNCETNVQVAQLYVKALFLANLCLDREQNQNNFWMTISMIQALQNGSGASVKRTKSVPELEKATYPGDKFDVPQKKKKWRNQTAERIAEQKKLAASDSDFLDQIEAVLEFLTMAEHANLEGQMSDHKTFLPFPLEFLKTIKTVQSAQTAQTFKQKLSDIFNENCSPGGRVPFTSADWRKIALSARAAALKAIEEQRRARRSAEEAWAFGGREQRRRFAIEETLQNLRHRIKESAGIL